MQNTRFVVLVVAALAATASLAGAQSSTSAAPRSGRAIAGRGGHKGLLRSVTLSVGEKAKVKEIHTRYRTEGKALRESLRPAMAEAKAARQKGDTAAARAILERTKGDREKVKALRERQKSDVRGALSPEHQKQFDANVQQAAQQRSAAKKGRGGKGNHRSRAQRISLSPNG